MNPLEEQVSFRTSNSYSTLNTLSDKTKNVWIVFHGIGYLSRYFLKFFSELPEDENYIIAPQAPSKYYLQGQYKHVGGCWLTKENTKAGIENIIAYLDQVYKAERIPKDINLIVFGFSQGVSIAMRWIANSKIICHQLVLYAGGIPDELLQKDFDFFDEQVAITFLVGDRDEYLTEARLQKEMVKIKSLFGVRANTLIFEGKHEIKKELINKLV